VLLSGEEKEIKIAMLGEKAKAPIIRYDPENIVYSAAELTKIRPTFAMVDILYANLPIVNCNEACTALHPPSSLFPSPNTYTNTQSLLC
jgi:hypothetical protein